MIAVMITGTFVNGKRYGVMQFGLAAGITIGVAVFMLGGSIKSNRTDQTDSFFGLILMAGRFLCHLSGVAMDVVGFCSILNA